jgi:transcriptional regulator with GAF, ATPase, and Fis domain
LLSISAAGDQSGLFEVADGGTLFLDEIGELSLALQSKLLRVIQERELRRVGETRIRRVNVRILVATNRDLLAEVRAHRFRKDLYYRLDVITLHVLPLRERRDDLPVLTDQFLAHAATRFNRSIVGCTPAVLHRLLTYDWPGNVRELEHALERACAIATGPQIDVDDYARDDASRAHVAACPAASPRSRTGAHPRRGGQRWKSQACGETVAHLARHPHPATPHVSAATLRSLHAVVDH